MKLRTLALFSLTGALLGLLVLVVAGQQFWRELSVHMAEVDRLTAMRTQATRFGIAVDYATLLRGEPRVLRAMSVDAYTLSTDLHPIDHPEVPLAITHLEEIAQLGNFAADQVERARDVGRGATMTTEIAGQFHIHHAGLVEALENILNQRHQRILDTLFTALGLLVAGAVGFAALAVLAFLVVFRRISGPLHAIRGGIQALATGDLNARIVLRHHDELGELAAAFNHMAELRCEHETALAESEERFRQLTENIDEVFWMSSPDKRRMLYISPAYERIWGRPCETLYRFAPGWVEAIHPDDRPRIQTAQSRQTTDDYHEEYRIVRPDGTIRWIEDRAFPIRDAGGAVYRIAGVAQDITERRQLEEQLRRSQRLESVGQLTGGVAHDFNNLLTVVQGNAELLVEELTEDERLRPLAEMIDAAARRGAELTHHLLAFARKQPLAPEVVDINRLIGGMDSLLRRTLGEQIEIELALDTGSRPVLVDPTQLESALLNLALNARDAMPGGGKLSIETHNTELDRDYAEQHPEARPDRYVLIAVSDTGSGIAPEHLERVFEPFYTTKEKGKGTGLGLSMVYGFVKQSDGHVTLYSEPGQGTIVKLYLPRVDHAPGDTSEARDDAPVGGHETVLLVEDDALVRDYAANQLGTLGYRVLTAINGPEALAILRERSDIDLLFTDIIMPGGMSGRELADAARALRPGLKVLYTSGYTENTIVHHGRLDPGAQLLSKPYRRAELARKMRDVLAR